jgi:hypothetical protein
LEYLKDRKCNKKPLWKSSTFGEEDIFTASWLHQLFRDNTNIDTCYKDRFIEVLRAPLEKDKFTEKPLFTPEGGNEAGPHPLPLVRLLDALMPDDTNQTHNVLPNELDGAMQAAGHWFERNMHRQASFFRSKDFRFDAAELIFCLYGSLRTKAMTDLDPMVKYVLEIVEEAQERSVYWRPYRPMIANQRGGALLPVSIEVATTLLRVLEMTNNFDTFGHTLDTYFEWLVTQRVRFFSDNYELSGWHSENTYEDHQIHIWDTARVAMFLIYYHDSLQKHLQRRIIEISGFTHFPCAALPHTLENLTPFDAGIKKNTLETIRSQISESAPFSFLLYGPPGTAKTTLAKAIAKSRDLDVIQLTPSDFISGGEAEIEDRAKVIFEALSKMQNVLVFFDEIDRLILDRDSDAYGNQTDIFQFMTPSMLSKFQELRKASRVSFIIATNYADHIDLAIKREGRIDKAILCLPYDCAGRKKLLKEFIESSLSNDNWDSESEGLLQELSNKTLFYTYEELKHLSQTQNGRPSRKDLLKSLLEQPLKPPQISLSSYEGRMRKEDFPQKPWDEYLRLLLLEAEATGKTERLLEGFGKARTSLPAEQFAHLLGMLDVYTIGFSVKEAISEVKNAQH